MQKLGSIGIIAGGANSVKVNPERTEDDEIQRLGKHGS
jgi:hypothetical protein